MHTPVNTHQTGHIYCILDSCKEKTFVPIPNHPATVIPICIPTNFNVIPDPNSSLQQATLMQPSLLTTVPIPSTIVTIGLWNQDKQNRTPNISLHRLKNWTKPKTVYLLKTEPKSTDFRVGQTSTALTAAITHGSNTSWSQSSICSSDAMSSSSSSGTECSRQSELVTMSQSERTFSQGRYDCVTAAYEELVMKPAVPLTSDDASTTADSVTTSASYAGTLDDAAVTVDWVHGSSLDTTASSDCGGSSGKLESDAAATQLLDVRVTVSMLTGVTTASGDTTVPSTRQTDRDIP